MCLLAELWVSPLTITSDSQNVSAFSLPLDEFASNCAIQCTEVYEYAQSLGNNRFCLSQYQVKKHVFSWGCYVCDYG